MSKDWCQQYVANSLDVVVLIDNDGTIIEWTSRATEVFGWSTDEANGRKLASLIIRPQCRENENSQALSDLLMPDVNRRTVLTALCKSGEMLDVELSLVPLEVNKKRSFAATFRTISQSVLADVSELHLPPKRTGSLPNRSEHDDDTQTQQFQEDLEVSAVFVNCLDEILRQIHWPVAHGLMVDSLGRRIVSTESWTGPHQELVSHLKQRSSFESFELGQNLPGKVWESHRGLWVNGEAAERRFCADQRKEARVQSAFAIPVFVDGDIVAVLEFFHDEFHPPNPEVIRTALRGVKPMRRYLERRRWQELRTFLAAIVESSKDAIIGKDRNGKIVSWNEGAELVYGYTEDEAIGSSVQLILPEGANEEEQQIRDVIKLGQPLQSFETIRRHKSGELLDVSLTVSPIRDERGRLIGSAMIERNITPLKQTIRELFDREERLRLLMEASGEAIYGVDTKGECTFANRACVQRLGFASADDLLGRNMHQLIHHSRKDGTPYPAEECPIMQAVKLGKSVHIAHDSYWKANGVPFPVEFWASPIQQGDDILGAVVIFEDSTKKIAAERTRAEFAAIVESSGEAIIGKSLEGVITSWNQGATRLYGYERDEAIGKSYSELILRASIESAQKLDHESETWSVHTFETQRYRKRGEQIEVGITESGIRDATGKLVGIVSIERDITHQKRRELELEHAKLEAEIANQAKSEFVANISHELRTPMNAVLGMLRIALEEPLPTALRDYLGTACDSAESLLLILDDLLDFSRMESGKFELDPEPFLLHETVEKVMRTLSTRAHEKGLEFAFDINANVPDRLYGDPFRFSQVIMNLVGNAIKFTDSGEVFVGISSRPVSENRLELECLVRDTGIGIAKKNLSKIFEPFTQVDSTLTRLRSGSGLGLAICRELVSIMDGTITATSRPGGGSEFRFTAVFEVLNQVEIPPDTREISKRRTLIIDDNETNRNVLAKVLSEWNVECVAVDTAANGMDQIRRAAQEQHPFSVAIVDFHMPEKNGIEFSQEVRMAGFRLPIVLMVSASEQLTLARQTKKLGISLMLQKPVTRSDVFDAIMTVLKGSVAEIPVSNLPRPQAFRSLELLTAEDTPANQKVIRAILERRGHRVTIVESGTEALKATKARRFDAILMDVQMPFMDGIAATKAIRSLGGFHKTIPIIAMTAHARREDRQRCLQAGMSAYVSKPIHAEKLIELVERLSLTGVRGGGKSNQEINQDHRSSSVRQRQLVNLEIALKRMGGDRSILKEMIHAFLEDSPMLLESIQQNAQSGKCSAVHRAAHSLKGLAANFEADLLVSVARTLEQHAKATPGEIDTKLIKGVRQELLKVIEALKSHMTHQINE